MTSDDRNESEKNDSFVRLERATLPLVGESFDTTSCDTILRRRSSAASVSRPIDSARRPTYRSRGSETCIVIMTLLVCSKVKRRVRRRTKKKSRKIVCHYKSILKIIIFVQSWRVGRALSRNYVLTPRRVGAFSPQYSFLRAD